MERYRTHVAAPEQTTHRQRRRASTATPSSASPLKHGIPHVLLRVVWIPTPKVIDCCLKVDCSEGVVAGCCGASCLGGAVAGEGGASGADRSSRGGCATARYIAGTTSQLMVVPRALLGVGSPKKVARERWRMKWQVANGDQFIG